MKKISFLLPLSMFLSLLLSCTAEELPDSDPKQDPYHAEGSGSEDPEEEDPPSDKG